MKPRVYVVQESDKNLGEARRYGDLKILLTTNEALKPANDVAALLEKRLYQIVASDYILCIGNPVAIGLALFIALENTDGVIKVLKWDKVRGNYHEDYIQL